MQMGNGFFFGNLTSFMTKELSGSRNFFITTCDISCRVLLEKDLTINCPILMSFNWLQIASKNGNIKKKLASSRNSNKMNVTF